MPILVNVIVYLLIWCLVLFPFILHFVPTSVEKAYLQNTYSNYNKFSCRQKYSVLRLYRLQNQLKSQKTLLKNYKNKILEDEDIW